MTKGYRWVADAEGVLAALSRGCERQQRGMQRTEAAHHKLAECGSEWRLQRARLDGAMAQQQQRHAAAVGVKLTEMHAASTTNGVPAAIECEPLPLENHLRMLYVLSAATRTTHAYHTDTPFTPHT